MAELVFASGFLRISLGDCYPGSKMCAVLGVWCLWGHTEGAFPFSLLLFSWICALHGCPCLLGLRIPHF